MFWNGDAKDDHVDDWVAKVGFRSGDADGEHGHVRASSINGPTGAQLDTDYFTGFGVSRAEAAFCDVYPVYFVKHGTERNRQQGDAIRDEYDPLATQLARDGGDTFQPATLPIRPTDAALASLAASRFGAWLCEALLELKPEHVVVLSDVAWDSLRRVEGLTVDHGCQNLRATLQAGYGRPGQLVVGQRTIPFTPLVHPQVLQTSRQPSGGYRTAHAAWLTSPGG